MALPDAYVVGTKNIAGILAALQTAGVPERVTFEFLKTIGFKSSNDRAIIGVLKALGFLDTNGKPSDTYRRFRDPSQSKQVLAESMRQAYSDIFLANTKANELTIPKLKGIVAAKTAKGDRVVTEMARTFHALAKEADFAAATEEKAAPIDEPLASPPPPSSTGTAATPPKSSIGAAQFGYNIQIILPTTTDITVYNAIFRSLREHLF